MINDFIATDEPTQGLQRLVARFGGHAYDPHRHETYAVGHTLSGAQAFRYRGSDRVSVRDECMVIHPDEVHDGHAGAPEGFSYRMLYIEPWLICRALGRDRLLPFVPGVVERDAGLAALIDEAFTDFPGAMEPLQADAFIADVAQHLARRSDDARPRRTAQLPVDEVAAARSFLAEEFDRPVSSDDLERITGLDRFELSRAFRRLVGTSPHRYLVGRRLANARSRMAAGEPLAEVAAASGFADQSHMTRHFRARFGITPGRFTTLASSAKA
ncbi:MULTISPECIES: AraC family transcriptional regulator [Hyphomicrobiales]|jgi:AraC-like DNA-binding protein|uniref:AraC family transcriptional regulator n=1 Tax=Hyphomicrobiales TaxID=356 RepID=UPI000379FBB1|nr:MULTISPECIES: AraC family transcriptional regulator [Phyllobacteriaceae]MCX8573013.1 AraC family transcriptional regulator [Aminobacter sp. MET-1]